MQLTYRGVNYETNSATVQTSVPATDLKYRGASYRLNQAARTESLEAILKYRGAIYGDSKQAKRAAIAAPAPQASSVQAQARLLTMNHQRLIKNREQSMLSRAAAQVGVDTTNYWNHV